MHFIHMPSSFTHTSYMSHVCPYVSHVNSITFPAWSTQCNYALHTHSCDSIDIACNSIHSPCKIHTHCIDVPYKSRRIPIISLRFAHIQRNEVIPNSCICTFIIHTHSVTFHTRCKNCMQIHMYAIQFHMISIRILCESIHIPCTFHIISNAFHKEFYVNLYIFHTF